MVRLYTLARQKNVPMTTLVNTMLEHALKDEHNRVMEGVAKKYATHLPN
ncbi:MAG: hypothetical protein M5R37_02255 [Melioribacteraceae bacterium]|nr:hypothetical protein [Melioribacteraceae bacterium]